MRLRVIVTAVCCWSLANPGNAAVIIHAGRLIDGRSDKPRQEATITVEDLIKLTASGGVLSLAANGQNPQFTDVFVMKEGVVVKAP